ncbi:ABC transporter substrate-binding protein [Colwellia sp. D2M02]|uniref:ABC transporter substrate-binding protein n=1 Tax=Colwellia sp. D2M02 TaxID=2841562 RepID=UPI001C09316D|nr:ABC transporter substrate-binding protein [Colwellia sp. D2M02]MBU2892373.1 ABC transporter substrate-binding protein [Colwellia sp. D2M02]
MKTLRVFVLMTLVSLIMTHYVMAQDGIQKSVNVVMVNPSIKADPFWHKTEIITQQAAKALNINLDIIYGDGTRFFQFEALKSYFKNIEHSPDYIILINYPGNAKQTMDFLKQQNVKIITLEQTLSPEEQAQIGSPGELYKGWLGEIYFDNENAGYILASNLLEQAKVAKKKPLVAGISGHFGSESTLRNNGLIAAIKEHNAELTQIVHAGWSAEDAYHKTLKLLQRYPNINVIWSASDHMALGALKAIEELGLKVGKDIFLGGFDWMSSAIESINQQRLTASVGGHFLMGAIAIIAIYDIENGIPYQPFVNSTHNSFNLALINSSNVKRYYDLLILEDLKHVDFKKLANLYSREEQISTFNLLEMLEMSSKVNLKQSTNKTAN